MRKILIQITSIFLAVIACLSFTGCFSENAMQPAPDVGQTGNGEEENDNGEVSSCNHDFGEYVYNNDDVHGLHGTKSRTCRKGCGYVETVEVELEWDTYSDFPTAPVVTSTFTSLNFNGFTAEEQINKFKIVYSSDQPVRGVLSVGEHEEDFYLEAGTNLTYTSFTDYVLGSRSTYLNGEKVIEGKTYSGKIGVKIEPIKDGSVSFRAISFSVAKQYVPDKVIYVANDRFKVGSHLYYGGSLTYLEDLQDGKEEIGNIVNIHDGGRLIQQSYYGRDPAANGGLSYNPVQGGNGYGYSKIIDFDITEDTIYTKARAKGWLDTSAESLTPSIMENWYTIKEDTVVVKNTFVDFLNPSKNEYVVESPALYWVGALRNFSFYKGNNPWTNGNVNTTKFVNDGAGVGYYYKGLTETWTACLNDEGWGAGAYTPGITHLVSGYYGHDGNESTPEHLTYNPLANPTVYIGMDTSFSLNPFEKITYTYMLTTGSLDEIRETFYEQKDFVDNEFPPTSQASYDIKNLDFSKPETTGFLHRINQAAVMYDEDRKALRTIANGGDPYFGIEFFNITNKLQAEENPYVLVEYMIPVEQAEKIKSNWMSIYMGLGNAEWVTGNRVGGTSLVADGKWHVACVDFSGFEWYKGNINVFRVDFIGVADAGFEYFIKSIRFTDQKPEQEIVYEDTYQEQGKTWLSYGTSNKTQYAYAIDIPNKGLQSGSPTGWLLCKDGISYFECLVFEEGTKPEGYATSIEAEKHWFYVNRTYTRARSDAAKAYPGIGDTGASAGFTLSIPLQRYGDGKTYKVYIRAITNTGDACLMYYGTHNFTAGQNYLSKGNSIDSFGVAVDGYGVAEGVQWHVGWLICHDGVDHFEYLIVEKGSKDKDYPYHVSSEEHWQLATVKSYRDREDAANACSGIQGSGKNAGFNIEVDVSGLTAGKTYTIYYRAITKGGDACLYNSLEYTPQ